jgi:hypothetical protein
MSESQIEIIAAEVAVWHKSVLWHDAHGWESPEEESAALAILINLKRKLANLKASFAPDSELCELTERAAELDAEIAKQTEEGERWAETVEITMAPVGPDIIDRATRYFGSPQGYNGVLAYCRHQLTNYDALLTEANQYSGRHKDI